MEYGYEELFDYEKAMEGITVDHTVVSHTYSALDENGQLTKEHLYEIVKRNNEVYLGDANAVIKKVDDEIVLQICGIAHTYPGNGQDYSDLVWMGEGSAERMTSLYTGTAPMTYYNHVNYILTFDLATMLRDEVPANYMESVYFYDDVEKLFWAFDAKSEEEK